ncbi:PTS sugar transporter subunit IIA [Zwartia vadi]|uniref:PTS sugar transporter subunit IIA n=1 Tax=Zwartia vadi TaxID=3058168 RepID=UPI0025B58F0D|nr:PTS sugar transporter subunit IIA [Zwartia vadi]MDN3987320.1 PTS sugar transporter subunit IIA [Zwartia vadi]
MKLLSRILPVSNIVLDLSVTSKKRAFEQASLLFENNNGIERAAVYDNLFARERLGSTGLGRGIAVPHGRVKGIKHPAAAFFRLARPIAFDAPDREPVNQLLFIIAPEAETQQHLDILAEVAQRLSDASLRERLAIEVDPNVVHQLLTTGQA